MQREEEQHTVHSMTAGRHLLHPDTEKKIRSWHPDAENVLEEAKRRAREAVSAWGLTELEPLNGGAASIVAAGTSRTGDRVVLKAHLEPEHAATEESALEHLPGAVQVLRRRTGVLLLEHLQGRAPHTEDSVAVTEAVKLLHQQRSGAENLPRWEERRETLYYEYATRIRARAPHLNALVDEAERVLPKLLEEEHTVSHGDLQNKNLVVTDTGIRLIDPYGITAPAGWDTAFAAASTAAAGGDPKSVLRVAKACKTPNLAQWLHVASVAVAGTTAHIEDQRVHRQIQRLLEENPST